MRPLFRSPWLRALLIWTAIIGALVLSLLPGATTPYPPCNPPGVINPNPSVSTCPPDVANYEAIGVSLLVLIWLAVVLIALTAFAVTRLLRRPAAD